MDKEQERLQGEVERMMNDKTYYSFAHHRFAYVNRGIYVDQLMHWLSFFPREQLLIIRSEDLYPDPMKITRDIFDFLELPSWEPKDRSVYNYRRYTSMNENTYRRLTAFYIHHNQRLYDQLGIEIAGQ